MILAFLWHLLKLLLVICGIIITLLIIVEIIATPIKIKQEKKLKQQFMDALNEIADEAIKELEEQNKKKKTTRKPKNTNKKEEK